MIKFKFLFQTAIFTLIIFALYVFFYIFMVHLRGNGVLYYKNFILENTTNYHRIIIDSGSNSVHGIDAKMMQNAFNKLSLNISDNAGYPLYEKLMRLKKFTRSGDIVILPLEYYYYLNEQDPPNVYYNDIFGILHFYFDDLNLLDKAKFALNTPFSSVYKAMISHTKKYGNIDDFINRFNAKQDRGDYHFFKKSEFVPEYYTMNCEQYVFGTEMNSTKPYLSNRFLSQIKLMKKIEKEKDIKFIFAYPAVVGNKCYDGTMKNKFLAFNSLLKKTLSENGFLILGDYNDSSFPAKFINNSYYHVLPEARQIRTTRLIRAIKNSPVARLFYGDKNMSYFIKTK